MNSGVKIGYSLLMCGIETGRITTDYNKINDIVDFIMGGYWCECFFCFGFFIFTTFIIL